MCKTAIGIADLGVVVSVFAWEIIGRRISIAMTTNFVLDTPGNKILALRYCFPVADGNTVLQSKQTSCGK